MIRDPQTFQGGPVQADGLQPSLDLYCWAQLKLERNPSFDILLSDNLYRRLFGCQNDPRAVKIGLSGFDQPSGIVVK